MKITKRKLLFPIAILTTAFVSGGIVYALSSANFANNAATWAKANCTSAVASSKYNSVNGQKSIICYNYNKNAEQDETIKNINSATENINESLPHLVDANGVVLGIASYENSQNDYRFKDSYYDSKLKLFVVLDANGNVANKTDTYWSDNGCGGKPYGVVNGEWYRTGVLLKNNLLDKYYKVDTNTPVNIVLPTFMRDGGPLGGYCAYTQYNNSPTKAWPMTEVVPSVSYPVALPLTIK